MFRKRFIALAFAFLTAVTGSAVAAPQADVAKVAAMVTDKRVQGLLRKTHHFGDEFMGTTFVFVNRGKRYTLYNSGNRISADDPNSAWLAAWVRKNGTYSKKALVTFSDNGFDGNVDFGIEGGGKCYFTNENLVTKLAEGLQFRARWQKEYDLTIKAGIRHMKKFSKKRK